MAALALSSIGALLAWVLTASPSPAPAVACAVAAVLVAVLGCSLVRLAPFSLRWDGQAWHLGPPASRGNEPAVGELQVAIDLGGWLLLRWRPLPDRSARASPRWLPVQRRGLEPHWHALRCAVYSPRPALGPATGAAPDL